MSETISTEFREVPSHDGVDVGVDRGVIAEEEFIHYGGEHIERETELAFLEDGGVMITQKIPDQGVYDQLTLGSDVVKRLIAEAQSNG